MAAARWADIYGSDDEDDGDPGPWAARPATNTNNAVAAPRWADIYDNDDEFDLGPWAAYAAAIEDKAAEKKKKNRKRGKRKKKSFKHLTMYPDLAQEAGWTGQRRCG